MPPTMQWTTEAPTKVGWYWYHRWVSETPGLVFVNGGMVSRPFGKSWRIEDHAARWCGPLVPPDDSRKPKEE